MKKAITTRANDNILDMSSLSHPHIKRYADRCGADFIVINPNDYVGHPHYSILKLRDMLDEYDRVLSMDSDVLIMPGCPNLFDVVPYINIASVYEDKGTRESDRANRIISANNVYGDFGWRNGYINTGVFLSSKCHKNIFNVPDAGLWTGNGYDDVMIGWNIVRYGHSVKELSWKWNCMSMWEEPWFGASRFNAFIIHYAGHGFIGGVNRVDNMRADYEFVWGNK